MNAAATGFTAHLLSTDKREWSITVGGTAFAIVRTEPGAGPSWLVNPSKPVEVVDTWTLFVVADNGERIEVTRETGMRMNADPSGKRPSVATHTAHRIGRLMTAARIHADAITRLAVMLDKLMSEDDLSNAPSKARRLREAAAVALRFHRVIIGRNGSAYALVAGDAVLVVVPQGWAELTYRVGDRAVHGSYNIAYTGTITSISPKTITVVDRHGNKTKRMTHEQFVEYNDQPIGDVDKRNSDWMD